MLDRHRDLIPPPVAHHAPTEAFPAVARAATDLLLLPVHDRF